MHYAEFYNKSLTMIVESGNIISNYIAELKVFINEKRVLSVVLAFAVLICMFGGLSLYGFAANANPVSDDGFALYNPDTDDDKLTVALDDVSGAVGDIVDFSAKIKNNSGLFSASISLKYDSDVLRPVMAISGQELIVDTVAGNVLPSVISGPINEVTDEQNNNLGYQVMSFIFENAGMTDSTNNGILMTVKFEIIAKPTYGNTTSVVFTDCNDTLFASLDGVLQPVFDEGSVTVLDEATTTSAPTTLAPTTTVVPTTTAPTTTSAPTTTAAPTTTR